MLDEPIPTTRERSGTYDAIATAKPGEPLFPIQGGDPHGPATVEFWADLERRSARAEANAERAAARFRKAGLVFFGATFVRISLPFFRFLFLIGEVVSQPLEQPTARKRVIHFLLKLFPITLRDGKLRRHKRDG